MGYKLIVIHNQENSSVLKDSPDLQSYLIMRRATLFWDCWSRLSGREWFSLWGPPYPEERMIVSLGMEFITRLSYMIAVLAMDTQILDT